MRKIVRHYKYLCMILGLLTMIAGCRSAVPVNFYTLNAEANRSLPAAPVADKGKQTLRISVGPLTLPDYLDRPQLVTFTGVNRLELAESHRWAGPLKQEMTRVIAENVSVLTDRADVFAYPRETPLPPDCQVILDIRQVEARAGQFVNLKAVWWLSTSDRSSQELARISDIRVPVSGLDYETLVAAHSQALLKLSQEIADGINRLSKAAEKKKK
jgi:uncharacterized lipoprotein YmbA